MKLTRGDIIYHMLRPPGVLFLKLKFNMRVENNPIRGLKGQYLLLGHHVHDLDPIISNACSGRLIRYIAGDANQDNWLRRFLLGILESVPFAKNRSDAASIRKVMGHIKAGHPVGLYPEGGRTWDGATDYIIPSTAKLIKLLKVPVYAIFYKGGYLARPRWSSHPRRGRMEVNITQIFDRGTVTQKTADELYAMLVDKLDYNEFHWQAENRVRFRGKNLAEHIERLLYVCPGCEAVNSLVSQGNVFACARCKQEYSVDEYGMLHGCEFADTVAWNQWQRRMIPRIIREGYRFTNSELPMEKIDVETDAREKQLVQLTATPVELAFEGKSGTEVVRTKDLSSISITFMDVVEFYVGNTKYRFTFHPQRHMSVKLFYDLLTNIKGVF